MGAYTPTPRVEVAFGFGPYDAPQSGDWTTITDDVNSIETNRGRQSELDTFPAGTATFNLDNQERQFDPLNSAGPHYGELKPNVPVRVVAELTEPLWTFVDEFTGSTLGPKWTTVGGSPTVSGGDLTLSGGTARVALAAEPITDRALQVQVDSFGSGTVQIGWRAGLGVSDALLFGFRYSAGTALDFYLEGVAVSGATLSGTNHKWLRLRVQDGSVYWDRSANGTSWTNMHSEPEPTWAGFGYPVLWMAAAGTNAVIEQFKLGWALAPIWRGVVDMWPAEYSEGGFRADLDLPCSDVFKVFSERALTDSFLIDVMQITEDMLASEAVPTSFAPTYFKGHYRMESAKDGEVLNVRTNRRGRMLVRTKWENTEGLVPTSPDAMVIPELQPASGLKLEGAVLPIAYDTSTPGDTQTDDMLAGTSWTLAMVVQFRGRGSMGTATITSGIPTGGRYTLFSSTQAADDSDLIQLSVDASGAVTLFINGAGGTLTIVGSNTVGGITYSTVDVMDGLPHRIVAVRRTSTAQLYVDGVLVASGTGGGTGSFFMRGGNHYVGRSGIGDGVNVWPAVAIDELMIWQQTGFTSSFVQQLDDALQVGRSAERTPGDAIETVLDFVGWPAELRAIDPGETIVRLPANLQGDTVLELLQKVSDSEFGRLFVDAAGRLTFHAANRFETEPVESTVQYAFSDTDASSVSIDGRLRVAVDDEQVFEAAEVERQDGERQRAESTSTPAKTYSIGELLFSNDLQALRLAERIVFLHKDPKPRPESWEVWPEAEPTDWPTVLGLDIGHRVQLVVTPRGVGSEIDIHQHLELFEHHITAEDWVIVMNGSPVDESAYFQWGGVGATNGWGNGAWR